MKYNYQDICSKIDRDGYCLIDKFWDKNIDIEIDKFYQNSLKPLVKNTTVDRFGNRNFSLADNEIKNNPFNFIKESPEFKDLYNNILKINKINLLGGIDVHNIIALQKNEKNTSFGVSSKLHFDAFYITIIIPIKKTENALPGRGGSLILYPNIRKLSSNSIINYFIKFLIQNSLFRFILKIKFFKKILNFKIVSSEKNKLLIFYGYRTLHGNESLLDRNLKVHSIFHIYNPHKNSAIDKWIFKRNEDIRKRKLNN